MWKELSSQKAIVIFSGGQDSTTCLGWALQKFAKVEALSFSYGQNHSVELDQARKICEMLEVPFTLHELPSLYVLADSALVTGEDVNKSHSRHEDLPSSFVPNRNALFLTIAHAFAQKVGASYLVMGVCETDYSGYPDCRQKFIFAFIEALNLGSNTDIKIVTPLMHIDKAATFKLAEDCKILPLVVQETHTCYNGARSILHDWGRGCGECPACKLRAAGYEKYLKTYKE